MYKVITLLLIYFIASCKPSTVQEELYSGGLSFKDGWSCYTLRDTQKKIHSIIFYPSHNIYNMQWDSIKRTIILEGDKKVTFTIKDQSFFIINDSYEKEDVSVYFNEENLPLIQEEFSNYNKLKRIKDLKSLPKALLDKLKLPFFN